MISTQEITELQNEYQSLNQQSTTEIIREAKKPKTLSTQKSTSNTNIEAIIDNKMGMFLTTLSEKDKVIEDKNKLMFMLQQRIGELETKLQTMVALPDYNQEKQTTMLEKQRLESKIFHLQDKLKGEKNKSLLFLGVVAVVILIYLILTQMN